MAYRVFISYKYSTLDGKGVTRDFKVARDLYATLTKAGIKTFFSEKELSTSDFMNEIYDALEESEIMIVVGTKPEYIRSDWVRDEWSSFVAELNGGRKPNGDLYTYLDGMTVNELPSMLYKRQSFTPKDRDKLINRIMTQLGTGSTILYNINPRSVVQPSPRLHVQAGETIRFGQYPQGAKGEVQPLMWRVLAVENGKALLITDKLIDYVVYKENWIDVSWETCTLRSWLNKEFIENAFSGHQQTKIATVTNQNPGNAKYGTQGGSPTKDRVFVLSTDEAQKYFLSDADRKAYTTDCVFAKGYAQKDRSEYWWLRSPGGNSNYAAFVSIYGKIDPYGSLVQIDKVAVRSAFWLNL